MTERLPPYDVVMATRNRPEAVRLSLPLVLAQRPAPRAVVVVDGSDDPAPVAAAVAQAGGAGVRLLRAAPGLTHQRNVGLAALPDGSPEDVVLFPDDDSLLAPGTAREILALYARGAEVAAVCTREAREPPAGVDLGPRSPAPPRGRLRRLRQRITLRAAALNPFLAVGERLGARHPDPPWLAEAGARRVPYMTGFRMSFRRRALSGSPGLAPGFDEALARYAWFEDIDASYAAMRHGLVLAAERAAIFHHRFPGRRGEGFEIGLWAMLNRAYLVMKHVRAAPDAFPRPGWEAWRLRLYLLGRALAYVALTRDRWGWARARGAFAGLWRAKALLRPGRPAELAERYRRLSAR